MASRGYTTALLVAQELGVDLTAPQLDQCADLIEGAEAFIDHETGRAWAVTSPTTDELHPLIAELIYLRNKPVTAVTAVKSRSQYVGALDTTLVANSQYELIDATNGILLVNGYPWSSGDIVTGSLAPGSLLKVSYTSSTPVPGDIQRAATLLVADMMQDRLNPDYQGIESYRIAGSGDEYQVKLTSANAYSGRFAEALRIIRSREALVFA